MHKATSCCMYSLSNLSSLSHLKTEACKAAKCVCSSNEYHNVTNKSKNIYHSLVSSCTKVKILKRWHSAYTRCINLKRLSFAYVNTCKNPHLENHFIHTRKKRSYYIFKTCCIISLRFSTKCHLHHNFIFSCSSNVFHAQYAKI
jgi:hypothetical protein